jgi:hypothetical protein
MWWRGMRVISPMPLFWVLQENMEILGLHPSTLRARMHKLGIVRPEIKKPD